MSELNELNDLIIRECIEELDTIKRRLTGMLSKQSVETFQKPEYDEVYSHFVSLGRSVEAMKFWNYYESNGWRVGKNKMKSWPHAASQWVRRVEEREKDKRSSASDRHDEATKRFLGVQPYK